MRYEYKVVPAPEKGEKARGLKTPADRFAHVLARVMNEQARDGWEFQRTETLPCNERKGFTGSIKVYHTLMVFRRPIPGQEPATARPAAPAVPAPAAAAPLQPGPGVAPVPAPDIIPPPPQPVPAPPAEPRITARVPSWMRRKDAAEDDPPR